jgi:hypothetical protein
LKARKIRLLVACKSSHSPVDWKQISARHPRGIQRSGRVAGKQRDVWRRQRLWHANGGAAHDSIAGRTRAKGRRCNDGEAVPVVSQ